MCPASPFAERRKKRVCSHDGGGLCSGVNHRGAFGEKVMRQQENRRACVRRCTRLTFLGCFGDLELCSFL